MKRRDFIILTGIGASSATLLSACGHPENKLIPALIPDELYVPGVDYFKASACGLCEAGCGILVRTREHRANKIEGNPLHPVNRGGLCARGQAGLQQLYNPDRIKTPLRREGERGAGRFVAISWDEAIKEVADRLRQIKSQSSQSSSSRSSQSSQSSSSQSGPQIVFVSDDPDGVSSLVAEMFISAYGSGSLIAARPLNRQWLLDSYARIYGKPVLPLFDIANASYVMSFGARFLETWRSPVMYARAYGEFRVGKDRARGKMVQVEPRMSQTGANADQWLAARAGTEGLLALAMAEVIVREGLVKSAPPAGFISGELSDYAPENRAEQIGIAAEKIIAVAREYGSAKRAVAIGEGSSWPQEAAGPELERRERERLQAIHYLNHLVGNINKVGGVILPDESPLDAFEDMRPANRAGWEQMRPDSFESETVKAVMLHHANPVHAMEGVGQRLKQMDLIMSFASFMDETTELADLVLPDDSYLERWDLRASQYVEVSKQGEAEKAEVKTAVAVMQPVIEKQHDTRQTGDVLIAISREMKEVMKQEIKQEGVQQIVKREADSKSSSEAASKDEAEEQWWSELMERGVWVVERKRSGKQQEIAGSKKGGDKTGPATTDTKAHSQQQSGAGSDAQKESQSEKESEDETEQSDYPLVMLAYEQAGLGMGEQANLPWLQELPDAMTTVMWGSWIEINPATAARLGIADGELIEAQSQHGKVTAPAVIYPAIRPEALAIAYGQGHSSYGRYAKARGVNAAVVAPIEYLGISGTAATRVRVKKAEGKARLVRFGTNQPEQIESKR